MKTALIIGGSGLLGQGIAAEMLSEGWEVSILSRGRKPLPKMLSRCESLIADRSQAGALTNIIRNRSFDVVVDCAAYNQQDAKEAFHAFSGKAKHYWFISSDFVYAADSGAQFPIRENAAKQTDLPYATGKLEAEAFLLNAANQDDFPVTILRPPHLLGAGRPAGCDPAAGGRDATLVDRIRNGDAIPLLADGLFLIQPIWTREVGRCIHQLSNQPGVFGKLFNIAGAECVSVFEYYRIIAELCQMELKNTPVDTNIYRNAFPKQAHLARHRMYDTQALQSAGYTPSGSLIDAIQETVKYSL